jgi:alpha-galactosidase
MIFNTQSTHCLTASKHTISFANCTGSDSQVWQVTSSGAINPLSDVESCLTPKGKSVGLSKCGKGKNEVWSYSVTGNLKSVAGVVCLTEGSQTGSACGWELNSQVWALPAGVPVYDREAYAL